MAGREQYVVALTGGIASGKTAVSDAFADLGAEIIDTDLIAREVVKPGSALLQDIAAHFGKDIIADDGQLDRRALRERVFSDPVARKQLEALMHPAIRSLALQRIAASTSPYCVLVIPLLAESGGFPGVDRVLLVEAATEVRIARLMARDGVDRESALAALSAQASDEDRRALADDVIDNSGSLEDLRERVAELWVSYLELAGTRISS
jgi:dephospho-CoA kinase